MNKGFVYTLLITVSAIASLCSCQNELELDNNTNIDIPIPSEGYIFFSSGITDTRGVATPTGPLKGDFNVLGYRYPSTWVAINPQARQSLRITYTNNDNKLVDATETNKDNHVGVFGIDHASTPNYSTATPGVQTIIYDNTSGSCSYTPLQSWQKNLKYAFFAWYPTTLVANGGNNAYEGSPYITYTLPVDVDRTARQSMVDVLTACRIDYTKRDGLTVPLKMKHRLAALDIKAESLITASALQETYNSEFGTVADNAEVVIDVTSLSLTLNGIHTSATIPLDDTYTDKEIEATGSANKTYTGFAATNDVTAGEAVSLVGDDELLLLIPQTGNISANVNVSYTVKCGGKEKAFTGVTPSSSITINGLESGVYHYLLLTFTKSGLFVQANKAVTWKDKTDVEHTFE